MSLSGQVAAAPPDAIPNCGVGSAAGTPDVCGGAKSTTTDPVISILKAAIDVISILTGAFAVIFIIIAGLRLVISGGDTNGVAAARSALMYAVVGIIVTSIAQTIVVFVLDKV
jgi:hypothetical protein